MKYVDEMGSDAMIYITSFMKTGSGIQKLYFFFQNKESRLK
jgi:hypothetical protein